MSWTSNLLDGLAVLLNQAGAVTYRASGVYQPGDAVPLVMGELPQAPDKVVGLTPYPVDDDAGDLNDTVLGVQFRARGSRGDQRTVIDITDALFDALQSARMVTLGGVRVVQIWHSSGADLGVDTNGRPERSENYYIQATRPSAHRPD